MTSSSAAKEVEFENLKRRIHSKLVDKLDRQILKHKERFQVNKHSPGIKRIPQA